MRFSFVITVVHCCLTSVHHLCFTNEYYLLLCAIRIRIVIGSVNYPHPRADRRVSSGVFLFVSLMVTFLTAVYIVGGIAGWVVAINDYTKWLQPRLVYPRVSFRLFFNSFHSLCTQSHTSTKHSLSGLALVAFLSPISKMLGSTCANSQKSVIAVYLSRSLSCLLDNT